MHIHLQAHAYAYASTCICICSHSAIALIQHDLWVNTVIIHHPERTVGWVGVCTCIATVLLASGTPEPWNDALCTIDWSAVGARCDFNVAEADDEGAPVKHTDTWRSGLNGGFSTSDCAFQEVWFRQKFTRVWRRKCYTEENSTKFKSEKKNKTNTLSRNSTCYKSHNDSVVPTSYQGALIIKAWAPDAYTYTLLYQSPSCMAPPWWAWEMSLLHIPWHQLCTFNEKWLCMAGDHFKQSAEIDHQRTLFSDTSWRNHFCVHSIGLVPTYQLIKGTGT